MIETSTIFKEDLLTKPDKASLVKESEKNLSSTHYNFNSISSLHSSVIFDFMAITKKVTLRDLNSIGHILQAMLKRIESTGTAQDLHLVYGIASLNIPLKSVRVWEEWGTMLL